MQISLLAATASLTVQSSRGSLLFDPRISILLFNFRIYVCVHHNTVFLLAPSVYHPPIHPSPARFCFGGVDGRTNNENNSFCRASLRETSWVASASPNRGPGPIPAAWRQERGGALTGNGRVTSPRTYSAFANFVPVPSALPGSNHYTWLVRRGVCSASGTCCNRRSTNARVVMFERTDGSDYKFVFLVSFVARGGGGLASHFVCVYG